MIDFNSLTYFQKVNYIFLWLQLFVATAGFLSNALTFSVYMRKRMRKYSFSLYIKALAITDTVTLIHDFRHWLAFVFGANLDLVAPFFCAVDEYQPYTAALASICLLSLISLDRLITIAFPNRFKIRKSLLFQIALIFSVLVYASLTFIDMPLNTKIITLGPPNATFQLCLLDVPHIQKVTWINLANLIFVNVLLNNTLSVLMIIVLYRSRKRLTHVNNHIHRRDRKFAFNAIGLNLMSTLCKLPIAVALFVSNLLQLELDEIQMLFNITLFIINIDSGASFFINLTVNSVFYDEFLVMFRLKKQANQISSTSGGTNKHVTATLNKNSNISNGLSGI